MKLKILFLALAVFFSGVASAAYPDPVGHVNDFANIIPQAEEQKMEEVLRAYRKDTLIEIAVVTVPSLEGTEIEEYTIGLAQKWGVGQRKKDNGLVILVAPNERKVRIEVGYGLEGDIPDAHASRIIRENIIPYFKKGDMPAGIVAGVAGVLNVLGTTPYEIRLEERQIAKAKAEAESARNKAAIQSFLIIAAPVAVVLVLLIWAVWCVKKILFRRKKNREARERIPAVKKEFESVYAIAQEELKKKDVSDEAKKYLMSARDDFDYASAKSDKAHPDYASVLELMLAAIATVEVARGTARDAIKFAERARREGPSLLSAVPKAVEKAEKAVAQKNVSHIAKRYAAEARTNYEKASGTSGDLTAVFTLLLAAKSLADNAIERAGSDIANADRSSSSSRSSRRSSQSSKSSDDSSWSYGGSSSSSSSSDSGFSGFGGGGFGGGGATGSW